MKNKFLKYRDYFLLTSIVLFVCYIMVLRLGVFGSRVDWINQHSVIPEYFRQLFYKTKNPFPNFALSLGAGQNIYNFAYYGLYSPVILPAYFLPFLKMSDYLMGASIFYLLSSVLLLYYWMGTHGFEKRICLFTAVIFLLATPMVFQSYNQVMFVNYMPFLLWALIGVDRYFKYGRWGGLFGGTFLMILTSFYFSVSGLCVIVLYGTYRYFKEENEKEIKKFGGDWAGFLLPIVLAVLICSFYLLPTAEALLDGRQQTERQISLLQLFLPYVKLEKLFFSPYGIGIGSLLLTVLFSYLIREKCEEKILGYGILFAVLVPAVEWILNGGLYDKDKVLIPFLPICCYLIADYFTNLKKNGISKHDILPYAGTIFCVFLARKQQEEFWILFLADAVLMLFIFVLFFKKREVLVKIMLVANILILCIVGIVINQEQDYVLREDVYEKLNGDYWEEEIEQICESDSTVYRTEPGSYAGGFINRVYTSDQLISSMYSSVFNRYYYNFREKYLLDKAFRNSLMQGSSKNPLFLRFMGVKYLVTDEKTDAPYGYECIKQNDKVKVWKNEQAVPLLYMTNQFMSREAYRKLTFPYNQLALTQYAVREEKIEKDTAADEADNYIQNAKVKEVKLDNFPTENVGKVKVKLPREVKSGSYLFLSFSVINKSVENDVTIRINGVTNKLTESTHEYYNNNPVFHYVFGMREDQKNLVIEKTEGEYEIKDVKAYVGSIDEEKASELIKDPAVASIKEDGDGILADVDSTEAGYVVSSIPYDKHFTVEIDGKEVNYEKVNTAFLGFKVKKGQHHIQISYKAPGAFLGRLLSAAGLIFLLMARLNRKVKR